MIRQGLGHKLAAAVVVALVATAPAAAPAAGAHSASPSDEPVLTFVGGGWGHGIGMSQYGAYGRAVQGQTHEQILAHYYPDTTLGLLGDFGVADDVDVRLAVRSTVAVSTPLDEIGAWEVRTEIAGEPISTSATPVTAAYDGARWSVSHLDADGNPVDVCAADPRCEATSLDIVQTVGSKFVVEEFENGPNVGVYTGGRITLHPAGVATATGMPSRCGAVGEFCVVHANLGFDQYLYGLAEVPSSWPLEALESQAVAGRSYAAASIRNRAGWGEPFDLYATTTDQYYAGWAKQETCAAFSWCAAVDATSGVVVVHEGTIATTFYSSSNGGHSALPSDVWESGSDLAYLAAHPDPFDGNEANPNASWERTYTVADVSRWLNAYVDADEGDQLHVGDVERIVIDNVPASGRINFADVTIHGSAKSVQVLRNGEPYGYRLFDALRQGCLADDRLPAVECEALRSTKFVIVAFHDIGFDDYFYTPVQWMTAEALTTGTGPNRFAPGDTNTRAQLATFLWRFAGEPAPADPSPFADVPEGTYFTDAVAWLAETGVTNGTSDTEFSPSLTVNRAQAATFLWRFAGSPAPTVDTTFVDVEPGRYYTDAVRWMVEWGITTGTSPTEFSPDDPLTRGQIATFLWRLAGQPGAFADGLELAAAMRTP